MPDAKQEWDHAVNVLRPLLAAGAELKDVKTVGDALSHELVELAGKIGMAAELNSIRVETLVSGIRGPASICVGRLEEMLPTMSATQQLVFQHRLLRKPSMTLAEVGSLADVTRERIRQIQQKVERRVAEALGPEMRLVASVLSEELAPILDEQAFNRHLDAKLGRGTSQSEHFFRNAVTAEMGYSFQNDMCINEQARSVIVDVRGRARTLGDDAGLVEEAQLVECLPSEEWNEYWPLLRQHTGLHVLHGFLSIRDSAKARAKAALMSIGRAATRQEIADRCGLSITQTAGAFSNIPSVVRASKDKWGLKEWVDDEYDGIVGEIIQRINEDGGSTTTERLLRELPYKFDVSLKSVYSYMHTPKFVIQDGWIRLARPSTLEFRDLDDVVHGRDVDGAPYWTFAVEPRFFDGYSVLGVPPEFAKALGCEPDGGTHVHIENLPLCRDLSLRWRLASTTGASLGYVADALLKLDIQVGQIVRVTLKGPNRVLLTEHRDPDTPPVQKQADAILERMLNRRRVL